jgi:hypothetical protein
LVGHVALEKSPCFPKAIHRRQAVKTAVTIFIKANDPFIVREPSLWDRTGCAGPIPGLIGQMVGMERAFGRATSFALTTGSAVDGFRRLFPDVGLQECLVFHGASYCIYAVISSTFWY